MELLLKTISFTARAQRHQLRKDGETSYVAHLSRVVLVLRHLLGVEDERVLTETAVAGTLSGEVN